MSEGSIMINEGSNVGSASADVLRSEATRHLLQTASRTLVLLSSGITLESARGICKLLLPETRAVAVAMTDREQLLAYVGKFDGLFVSGIPIHMTTTFDVLAEGVMKTYMSAENCPITRDVPQSFLEQELKLAGIVAPIIVQEETVGALKFYYDDPAHIDDTQRAITSGFSEIISTQLSSWELELQAELTARAEIKALQAQINPHFLFNTINAIAALTRTNPTRARLLLREFAAFYRQTLENPEGRISLTRELEQTKRYLVFEKARFGEDRIQEFEHIQSGCEEVRIPAFTIQPVVENAVRHAMRDDAALTIDIHIGVDPEVPSDILIAVTDDGLGMAEDDLALLLADVRDEKNAFVDHPGIALRNVAARLRRFYGFNSGIEIVSRLDVGTCVTLRLAHAIKGT